MNDADGRCRADAHANGLSARCSLARQALPLFRILPWGGGLVLGCPFYRKARLWEAL